MNHDVFISYSSKNPEAAQAICHVLEENGIKCWIAPRDIPPGYDYGDLIDTAILECKVFLFVYSSNSLVSPWCKGELNVAFSEGKTIVPYRIDSTPIKGAVRVILNQTHWIDSYPDFHTRFDELVQIVGKYVGVDVQQKKPAPQPPVPPVPPTPTPTPTPKPRRRWWLWGIVAALMVALGVVLFGGEDEKSTEKTTKVDVVEDDAQQQRVVDSLAQVAELEKHRSDSLALVAQRLEKEKAEQERLAQEQKAKAEAERKAAEKAEEPMNYIETIAKLERNAQEQEERMSVWLEANKKELNKHTGIIEGHEYVDLGLSVLWATCNLGAEKPSDKGSYCWISNSEGQIKNGIVENDIASIMWNSSWCLPTNEEWNELVEKCEWVKGTFDNSDGWWITGPSGASIWLPAGGCVNILGEMMCEGSGVYYSGTISSYQLQNCVFVYDDDHRGIDKEGRLYTSQKLVRPVVTDKAMKLEEIKKTLEGYKEQARKEVKTPTFGLG